MVIENEIIDMEPTEKDWPKLKLKVGLIVSDLVILTGLALEIFGLGLNGYVIIVGHALLLDNFLIKQLFYRDEVKSWLGKLVFLSLMVAFLSMYISSTSFRLVEIFIASLLLFVPIYFFMKPVKAK